ncbi:phospholipid/cholesterol/gamma-HCH transport system ATP-binding protein [Persephonella hydrogeniphila]|uniref:Phospholipid/cholesterol/gamma-HCH transport system ATP-binding protein n=1 Tax=Persephonella hydrogeniphila TaxID=198703 RepID=A0A285NNW4_9AQUI|nr:ATP-binding cassette domain-containing protein [Persephonella hydrogeniphila]SNZ11210.1 phospholipid/cholesterol/gamma-HCH transport system ATP-binding protein [Persephonella hydrogeniphila]
MNSKIIVKNLVKKFGDREVLKNISFDVKEKEIFVLMGGSGSGKSTTIKHIIGLLKPTKGEIIIDGIDITKLPEKELIEFRKKMGYLFQEGALFDSLKVWENVGFYFLENTDMPVKEIYKLAQEKLSLVGLKGIEELYPSELSGGMRKRVSLARAISTNPEIILYDEPTSGLDPVTSAMIDNLIVNLRNSLGVTSIVVTHDLDSAFGIGDRIAMIHKGKIYAIGTPEEIRKNPDPIVQQFINRKAEGPITEELFKELKSEKLQK